MHIREHNLRSRQAHMIDLTEHTQSLGPFTVIERPLLEQPGTVSRQWRHYSIFAGGHLLRRQISVPDEGECWSALAAAVALGVLDKATQQHLLTTSGVVKVVPPAVGRRHAAPARRWR